MDSNGIVRVVTKRMVTFCHDPYNAIKIHSKAQVLIKTSLQETYKSILSKSVTKRDVSMQKINLRQDYSPFSRDSKSTTSAAETDL